jgi:hypothetical protein
MVQGVECWRAQGHSGGAAMASAGEASGDDSDQLKGPCDA